MKPADGDEMIASCTGEEVFERGRQCVPVPRDKGFDKTVDLHVPEIVHLLYKLCG